MALLWLRVRSLSAKVVLPVQTPAPSKTRYLSSMIGAARLASISRLVGSVLRPALPSSTTGMPASTRAAT